MKQSARRLLAVCFIMSGSADVYPAQLRDSAALDPAQALRELDSLTKMQNQQAAKNWSSRQETLETAAEGGSAAGETYKKAVEALHNGSNADFADWARDKGDLLRSAEMQNAIMFHARYLTLGLKARQAADKKSGTEENIARELLVYVRDLANFLEKERDFSAAPKEAKELLDKPVQEGVFVRWLGLSDYLPGKDRWEEKPGNLEGILEKNVRIPLRTSKNAAILAAWDTQIEILRQRAASAGAAGKLKIEETDIPRAVYGRALDKKLLGLRNGFLRDTLSLARQHMGHPDWEKWSKSLRDELATTPDSAQSPDAAQ